MSVLQYYTTVLHYHYTTITLHATQTYQLHGSESEVLVIILHAVIQVHRYHIV